MRLSLVCFAQFGASEISEEKENTEDIHTGSEGWGGGGFKSPLSEYFEQ